jgi:hypothetical protein
MTLTSSTSDSLTFAGSGVGLGVDLRDLVRTTIRMTTATTVAIIISIIDLKIKYSLIDYIDEAD